MIKYLLSALLCLSANAFACDDNHLKGQTDAQKFLSVVEDIDFLYIGKVARLYRLPETRDEFPGYNGFVFKVEELIKGETLAFMEAEQSSWCGVSSPLMENYWPSDIGTKYVVAGVRKNDTNYIVAVYPYANATDVLHRLSE